MRYIGLLSMAFLGLFLAPTAISEESKPVLSKAPLTAEQVHVYRALLKHLVKGADTSLNLANQTEPLDMEDEDKEEDSQLGAGCLKGIKLEKPKAAAFTAHILDARVIVGKKMVLVDPEEQAALVKKNDPSTTIREGKKVDDAVDQAFQTGMFSLSEIMFDEKHRWALVSFSFYCGRLCGSGAVVVLEKSRISHRWKVTSRECAEWIS